MVQDSRHFEVIEGRAQTDACEETVTYGVAATISGVAVKFDDLSANRQAVETLCARLREGAVAPEHVTDIVNDFLAEEQRFLPV